MAKLKLTLITGRSTRQGTGISTGKQRPEYREATSVIGLNRSDMDRLRLRDGDRIRLTAEFGTADVSCRSAEIPEGLAFIPFGPSCNKLIGGETYASGMPDSKHVEVDVERIE